MFKNLFVFAIIGVFCLFVAGCGVSESDICDTAKELISEKCAEMSPENPAKCVSVEITKQITETSWTAKAKLDNGTVIPISIKLHDNDTLEVDYSAWLSKKIEEAFDE